MGKMSRDKGRRGEREVVKLMVSLGFPEGSPMSPKPSCFACDQYRGGEEAGPDVLAEGYGLKLALESKLGKRVSIKAAVAQAERDCPAGHLPVARTREDRQEAIVSMPEWAFQQLINLIRTKRGWKTKG